MSIASVQEFLTAVSSDQALQEELATAMNAENDRESVTTLAQSKGYDFTSDELAQEIQTRQAAAQERQNNGELTEDELEAVAGGEVLIATSVIGSAFAAAGVGYAIGGGVGKAIKW